MSTQLQNTKWCVWYIRMVLSGEVKTIM